mgnify:CR=1 FL=1
MPNEPDKQIRLLTNIGDNDDFKGADENFLNGDRPMLAVVKKNVVVLEKLYKWLKSTTTVQRSNLKLLMIDDESDYGESDFESNFESDLEEHPVALLD